jgi:hypothetical protein
MATAITASTYYFNTTTFRSDIDAILLRHGIVDPQLAGHLFDIIYKQQTDKCDAAAAASAV